MKAVLISQLPRHQGCSFESGAGKWAGWGGVRVQGSALLTWTRTHRFAAWCFPAGSGAASCTCRGRPWRSPHAACRSASSSSRPGPAPTLSSGPVRIMTAACLQTLYKVMKTPDSRNCMRRDGLTWSCFLTRSFFWASVRRSSSVCGCATPSLESSALASALLSSCSSCSFSAELPAGTATVITVFSSSLVFSRSSWAEIAWGEHKHGIMIRSTDYY